MLILADCMRVLSMIFGLVRSIGRYSADPNVFLISHIFPPPFSLPGTQKASETGQKSYM